MRKPSKKEHRQQVDLKTVAVVTYVGQWGQPMIIFNDARGKSMGAIGVTPKTQRLIAAVQTMLPPQAKIDRGSRKAFDKALALSSRKPFLRRGRHGVPDEG